MLRPHRHRWATLLLLAAYVAASTVGGLFHDHGSRCSHEERDQDAAACSQLAGDQRQHADDADADHLANEAGHRHGGNPLHDDDCSVCRFVAQRVLACEVGTLDCSCELVVEFSPPPALPAGCRCRSAPRTLALPRPPSKACRQFSRV